ncbi:LCP family glycopolymer transferase [Bacillus sp. Y1]|jgi:polyisoprenyl-teichoic acid--peptidoglycan teichoic acid transferase
MMNSNRQSLSKERAKTKRKLRKRRVISILLIITLSIVAYVSYAAFQVYNAADNSYAEIEGREEKSELREEPVYISSDPFSVLLLGIENYSDENDQGRSDTIMVATFNPSLQTMKLVSIPRDTLVEIPEHRDNKINHSYAYGGKELVIDTVENFLDIPIDYYVTVNFDGFKNIVDILGGVTVDVPFDFDDINSKWERFYFKEGSQKLNGEEALVYARMRMKDPRGDFGRNERQRQIVTAVIDKLSSPSTLLKIDDIAGEIGENIETNMKVKEAVAFRKKYPDFGSASIEQLEINGYDDDGAVYYFVPDEESLEEIQFLLKSHLDLIDNTSTTSQNVEDTE